MRRFDTPLVIREMFRIRNATKSPLVGVDEEYKPIVINALVMIQWLNGEYSCESQEIDLCMQCLGRSRVIHQSCGNHKVTFQHEYFLGKKWSKRVEIPRERPLTNSVSGPTQNPPKHKEWLTQRTITMSNGRFWPTSHCNNCSNKHIEAYGSEVHLVYSNVGGFLQITSLC
jgi:hypothetical protein